MESQSVPTEKQVEAYFRTLVVELGQEDGLDFAARFGRSVAEAAKGRGFRTYLAEDWLAHQWEQTARVADLGPKMARALMLTWRRAVEESSAAEMRRRDEVEAAAEASGN